MIANKYISRRSVLTASAVLATAVATYPLLSSKRKVTKTKNNLLFVTEESNPKAQAAYNTINADFESETGISVTMEYPGFKNISRRVATLFAAQTPPELVWYGANTALEVAVQGQFESVDDLVESLNVSENMRLVVDGHNRSVPTSQQFCYGWYRSDLYKKHGLEPYTDWTSYLKTIATLNNSPSLYGNVIPSATLGASHILLETMFQKNDVHWFAMDPSTGDYEVALDKGDNLLRAIETLDFLHQAHRYSPEASNYNWNEIMSAFFSGGSANSYYVGARLLEQTQVNAPNLAQWTKPIDLPANRNDGYYVSYQGFHIGKNSNVAAAKQYIQYFLQHPAYMNWLHSVPLHLIPSQRSILRSEAYQRNEFVRERIDVLEFLDEIWGRGSPPYLRDGPSVNPWTGLYSNTYLGGRMLAERNIAGRDSASIVSSAADEIRRKKESLRHRHR